MWVVRRQRLIEAACSDLGFLQWGDALSGRQVLVGSVLGPLSPVGISIYEKCWYVCVMETCLSRQVLCTYYW